jgi:hypothetical protein
LALCREFVKQDEDVMARLKKTLIDSDNQGIPIQLGYRKAYLRFVETHFNDLKVILRELSGNTD